VDREKVAEEIVRKRAPEINSSILKWIIHTLVEDRELGQFFENIPGFCTMRNHPFQSLVGLDKKKLSSDLLKFLERTCRLI
jgi:hypothetical protein